MEKCKFIPRDTKQELHTALRRAIGCFAVGDPRADNAKSYPKWIKHAEKCLAALRVEVGTTD